MTLKMLNCSLELHGTAELHDNFNWKKHGESQCAENTFHLHKLQTIAPLLYVPVSEGKGIPSITIEYKIV